VFVLPFLLLLSSFPASSQQDDFLPPEQAYRFAVKAGKDRIVVTWTIAPGYYLYQKRLSFESSTPDMTLGSPAFPKGESHHDEYFGTQEIYRNTAIIPVPFTRQGPRPAQMKVELRWQGCADAGLCYPPTTWEATVLLP
jgi:thiol:disulfide interchange protein DsbD